MLSKLTLSLKIKSQCLLIHTEIPVPFLTPLSTGFVVFLLEFPSAGVMARSNKGGESFQRKHWSVKKHDSTICRNSDGHFCLNVEGGAELGLFPFVGEIRQDRIHYQSGKLHHGELILEVNDKRVPGMIKKDVIALIKRSADPVSLVTVKQSESHARIHIYTSKLV